MAPDQTITWATTRHNWSSPVVRGNLPTMKSVRLSITGFQRAVTKTNRSNRNPTKSTTRLSTMVISELYQLLNRFFRIHSPGGSR